MSRAATLTWFAGHEFRLAWRDWLSMMTAGKRGRERVVAVVLVVFAALMHLFAWSMVRRVAILDAPPDKAVLVAVTGGLLLSFSLMLSQAMEQVTRAFYARADLELILSSPVAVAQVFAVRIGALSVSTALLGLALAAPFINMLAWCGGARWLAAYGAVAAMGLIATAMAVALTVALFRTIGPKRTRLAAQIVAAVIGAAFVIGLQVAAIQSYGTISRFSVLQSAALLRHAPEIDSALWLPARAALGDAAALAGLLGAGLLMAGLAVAVFSPRFGDYVVAAASVAQSRARQNDGRIFRGGSAMRALRRKEWTLLRRDPWLVSQTLMQLLYLLPPALLLWKSFAHGGGALVLLVPVLVMAAGQLAGGLSWLAISGEDAPDLVATAPVQPGALSARQDRGGDGGNRAGVRAVRAGAGVGRADLRADRGARHRGVRGLGDRHPALVPHASQAQPFPPPPDLLAHGDLRGSLLLDHLGRHRRARRRRHLACSDDGSSCADGACRHATAGAAGLTRFAAYGHFTTGGIDERIDSTLPPVRRPKMVPRS